MPLSLQDRELKAKRAQYLQQQQLLKEEAAAKRCAPGAATCRARARLVRRSSGCSAQAMLRQTFTWHHLYTHTHSHTHTRPQAG
jgi:hypothetical protein